MDVNKILEEAKFLGVCSWISGRSGIDVKSIRIVFIVITIFGVGSPLLVYLLLYLIKAYL